MIIWTIRQILYLRQAFVSDHTPRQLALGCALGLVLGLVPKGNLLALLIAFLVMSLRLNLAAAMLSTLAFSLLAPLLDPVSHPLGMALLTNTHLAGIWNSLYELPLLPWTSFNNTVVLGNLVFGVIASLPFYFLAKQIFDRFRRRPEIAGLLVGPSGPTESSAVS